MSAQPQLHEDRRRISRHGAPALQRQESLFRLCPIPLALISYPQGRFLDVNGAFLRQLGVDAGQVVGRTTREIARTVDEESRGRLVERLASGHRIHGWQVWMVDTAGQSRAVELYADRVKVDGQDCTLIAGLDVSRAFLDPLTELPNRNLLEERLTHTLSRQRGDGLRTAVLFIDLDGLKGVNDTLGHWAGDELLKGVATRLRAALDASDQLARIGGDELVAVQRVRRAEDAVATARRLRGELGQPLAVGEAILRPRASIGVAVAGEGEGIKAADLLHRADVAMYRAKRTAADGVALFTQGIDREALSDSTLGRELATALDRCELEVHYQPIVRLDDLSIWGVEALARWRHPTRGVVPPSTFIALAEMSGQIHGLGREVLYQACRQAAIWRFRGEVDPEFVVSVNVSAAQLSDEGFATEVDEVLRSSGLPPGCLQIEITERVPIHRAVAATPLADLGVRLALDDFGEGFGCLSYLRALEIDAIKIDRSFVAGLRDGGRHREMIWTIVDLAARLGNRAVVAEGVETAMQLRALREIGCQLGQGFLFGEAMSAEELAGVNDHRVRQEAAQPCTSATVSSTHARSSEAVIDVERNGVSWPRIPLAISTPSS